MSADPRLARTVRQRLIARSMWYTIPGTLLVIWAAYRLVPPISGLEEESARFALATRWLLVAILPYAAMSVTIAALRFFEGAHDPTRGEESVRLQIHRRVMQNTLEQLVWFAICILALAPILAATEARLIPIACVFFLFARLLFWWGYLRPGTLGRAPAVQITFTLNMFLTVLALAWLVRTF